MHAIRIAAISACDVGSLDKVTVLKPSEIICLDEGFNGNDQLKINSTQKIKFSNQNESSQIIFRVF